MNKVINNNRDGENNAKSQANDTRNHAFCTFFYISSCLFNSNNRNICIDNNAAESIDINNPTN